MDDWLFKLQKRPSELIAVQSQRQVPIKIKLKDTPTVLPFLKPTLKGYNSKQKITTITEGKHSPSIVINKRKQITDHYVYKTSSGKYTDNVFSSSQPSTPNAEPSVRMKQIFTNDYANINIIQENFSSVPRLKNRHYSTSPP
jgi:hypothetical protein